MEGAGAAYRMILEAYWKDDRDTLRDLCDDDSYEAFVEEITARAARGETLDKRLLGIDSAKITEVEMSRGEERINVQIGRAKCRESVCRSVETSMVSVTLKINKSYMYQDIH